jgi:hypothetical protein
MSRELWFTGRENQVNLDQHILVWAGMEREVRAGLKEAEESWSQPPSVSSQV